MTRRLLLLNGMAALAAVIYHSLGWGFTSMFWWTDRYQPTVVPDFSQLGTPTYYVLRVVEQLVCFGLPAFLFVSGFFVAFAAGRDGLALGWRQVANRLKFLLIPYAFWSAAILAGGSLGGAAPPRAGVLATLVFGRAADLYYYVPLVTQLYILSPLVVPWVKSHWKPVMLAAGVLQLGIQLARYPVLLGWDVPVATWIWLHSPSWLFTHLVFWFILGTFVGINGLTFQRWVFRWKPALPWVTVGLAVLGFLEWEALLRVSGKSWLAPTQTVVDSLYTGALILTFVAFAEVRVPAARNLAVLGERSFGIYLIHAPVLSLLSKISYHLTPTLLGHQIVFLSLLVMGGIGIPLVLMAIVNRSAARPSYNYLFG
jgi:surface polysaccharide O-acyltransferase-like enzyme